MKPTVWNVVVVGRWNPAILTPAGIASRVFGIEVGVPVEVHVAMDGVAPHRVVHENCVVSVSAEQMIIEPHEPTPENLVKAMQFAIKGIESLPETPWTAAGYNVRYASDGEHLDLLEKTRIELDHELTDADFSIVRRMVKRTLSFNEGEVNLEISQAENAEISVGLNFHRRSQSGEDLKSWLGVSVDALANSIASLTDPLGEAFATQDND